MWIGPISGGVEYLQSIVYHSPLLRNFRWWFIRQIRLTWRYTMTEWTEPAEAWRGAAASSMCAIELIPASIVWVRERERSQYWWSVGYMKWNAWVWETWTLYTNQLLCLLIQMRKGGRQRSKVNQSMIELWNKIWLRNIIIWIIPSSFE